MDRFIATSRADSPDWPLPSLPPPSLTNVSKENRRHCRVFPTGMVNLSLAQMADTFNREQHNEHHAGDSYRQTEFIKQDFEKSAFDGWRMEKSRKKNTEKKREYIRPENLDDLMYAVDALQSQLDSPDSTTELSYPYYHAVSPPLNSPASTMEHSYPYYHALSPPLNSPASTIELSLPPYPSSSPPPTASTMEFAKSDLCDTAIASPASIIELSYPLHPSSTSFPPPPPSPSISIAELDACDTAIPSSSLPLNANPASTSTAPPTPTPFPIIDHTTPLHSHPPTTTDFIINPTTPLRSNPPTTTERQFARALHTSRPKKAFEPRRPPPPRPLQTTLATYDAMTSYRERLTPSTAKRAFASVVNRGFGGVVGIAARVSQKKRAMKEKKEKKTKMTFSEAVNKGFKDVFGDREEGCW